MCNKMRTAMIKPFVQHLTAKVPKKLNVQIHTQEQLVKIEKAVKELERRMYNVEVKDQNCSCFCRKI